MRVAAANDLTRRDLLVALTALGYASASHAQQRGTRYLLGYVWIGPSGSEHSTLDGMRVGLRDLGHSEGRDFAILDKYANFRPDRLPALFAELLKADVALILSPGNVVTEAAMKATRTVPVIATTPDLLSSGFVSSLARPGGNVTGISLTAGPTLSEKWLELVRELAPHVSHVAALLHPTSTASAAYSQSLQNAARAYGIRLTEVKASNRDELSDALRAIGQLRVGALVVESDAGLVSNRDLILKFASEHAMPTVYGNSDYASDGGLICYATSIFDVWRQLATYVDRVLKGSSPADLPVQQATNFRLWVNLKTAKTLGLTIPPTLLARADEVIE
jgi:putative tryptophan/tyrosine transport system substrate-binding protein